MTLVKIREDKEEVIVKAPMSPRRLWYFILLEMTCEIPFLLALKMDLISQSVSAKGPRYDANLKALSVSRTRMYLSNIPEVL